jgi:hypothetical protein
MARCGRYKCFTLMFVNDFQQFVVFSVYYSYLTSKKIEKVVLNDINYNPYTNSRSSSDVDHLRESIN